MQRYNLFQQAHFALQDALFNSAGNLQLNGGKNEKTAAVLQLLEATVALSKRLIRAKENTILPAVDIYEPAVVDAVKQKHAVVESWAQKLQAAMAAVNDKNTLTELFTGYMKSRLACMAKIEAWINPVLWYYYTDKELQQMEQSLPAIPMRLTKQSTA